MLRAFIAVPLSAVMLLIATSTNAGLDEGLVFYLSFDNVTDQTILDESGNGLDAELHENTEIVKGKYGNAIRITDQGFHCVNIPSDEKLKITGKITMMAWIYYPETWKGKRMLHWFDKDCHTLWSNYTYGFGSSDLGSGPEIVLFLGSRDKQGNRERQETVSTHKMGEEQWHHVAASYDGETIKIYVDGKVIGEEKKKFNFFGNSDIEVRIGCAKQRPQFTFSNGSIDEAAVWRRALSNDEIKQAMAGDFLAVLPSDKTATTWADVKKRVIAP